MNRFPCFQDAYLAQLRETFQGPQFRNAPRGQPSVERLGVAFRIDDPTQRHISLRARRTNLVFNFAEALWYLSGSDDLSFIGYYAPSIANYSADGKTLCGTAYGPRIFNHPSGNLNQWDVVLRTLAADRDSKRAVAQIFDPRELTVPGNIDVACTLALQFMIRDGRLHGLGFMRANDVFRGMVSDVFSFTFILELMARQIGVRPGSYHHLVGSLHVYDSDARWAARVLAEADTALEPSSPFPAMPDGDNWPYVREVLRWEQLLRGDRERLAADRIEAIDLPAYWRHVVALFELQRQIRHGTAKSPDVLGALPETYRSAVENRWPREFGALKPAS